MHILCWAGRHHDKYSAQSQDAVGRWLSHIRKTLALSAVLRTALLEMAREASRPCNKKNKTNHAYRRTHMHTASHLPPPTTSFVLMTKKHLRDDANIVTQHNYAHLTLGMSEFCAKNCKFCAPFLRILRNISTRFSYGKIACDTGVLSRVSWLVGPLNLRVTIQLTLSLRLLKMLCDLRLVSIQMSAGVSVAGTVVHFAEKS